MKLCWLQSQVLVQIRIEHTHQTFKTDSFTSVPNIINFDQDCCNFSWSHYRKGGLSTFDLILLTSLKQVLLILQTLFTFLSKISILIRHPYWAFPSVSIPWLFLYQRVEGSKPLNFFAHSQVQRVFILGPSHHVRLSGCAVSACSKYATPFYNLTIDRAINEELMSTGEFEVMSLEADEDEHSIEMHLPYLARVMQNNRDFTVVPVLVSILQNFF